MKNVRSAVMLFGLIVMGTGSVQATELIGPRGEGGSQIVVVNYSDTPVRVYVEDSMGHTYELGRVERGAARTLEAPAEFVATGELSVRVRPTGYVQNRSDPATIKTHELRVSGDETIVLWLDRDLEQSKVEIRAG